MQNNTIGIGIVALLVGVGGGYALASFEPIEQGEHMMSDGMMMDDHAMGGGMGGAMDDMMAGLEGKMGDDFDKAFLSEMIMHHEGAVEMAEAALKNAKHEEIKTMASAIISAQTDEIAQMKSWQQSWYEAR